MKIEDLKGLAGKRVVFRRDGTETTGLLVEDDFSSALPGRRVSIETQPDLEHLLIPARDVLREARAEDYPTEGVRR